MFLNDIKFKNHPILGNLEIDFVKHSTGKPYPVIVFVGENGCGKTSILSEIFNYSNSQYIVDKITFDLKMTSYVRPVCLFIRQDSKYCGAMNELTKVISGGKEPFPSNINTLIDGDTGYLNHTLRDINFEYTNLEEFVNLFGNEKVGNAAKSNELCDIKCAGEVLRMVDGSKTSIDLTTLSSGEQELLLKIREIKKTNAGTDFILFDEPETSLHPRWQRTILKNIIKLIQPEHGNDSYEPQFLLLLIQKRFLNPLLEMKTY